MRVHRQTHPIHFEDFSGHQFERLCFALLVRLNPGTPVEWLGQVGTDAGRDILLHTAPPRIVQCKNVQRLSLPKFAQEVVKLRSSRGNASSLLIICGGSVSAQLREKLQAKGKQAGFATVSVWSGPEFEEQLRSHAPDLLQRFTEGVAFPESTGELLAFSQASNDLTDGQIVSALALAFDRPAFRTHFHQESSLPRFKEALAETICTLNTGETPQHSRIPSRHQVQSPVLREKLDNLVKLLVGLRATFDSFVRDGSIKHCGCSVPDCPTFFFEHTAACEMDRLREQILRLVQELDPQFRSYFY